MTPRGLVALLHTQAEYDNGAQAAHMGPATPAGNLPVRLARIPR